MQPSTIVREVIENARQLGVLVIIPFVIALIRWNDLVAVGADTTTQYSVTFPTPHSFLTLWSFINTPTETGSGISSGSVPLVVDVGVGVLFGIALLVYVLITGLALAGFLGSIDEGVATGSFDFVANMRRYARPLVAYEALMMIVMLGFIGILISIPALFPIVAVALLGLAYLTYLTPYLVVVTDVGIIEAVTQSFEITTQTIEAVTAFVVFVGFGMVVSVPLSMLAYGNGVIGGVLAAAFAAPIGLLGSVAFIILTRNLTDVTSTSARV